MMTTLEQITYEAGRDALADQETIVAGIRQRTGTLLAAQALIASFLGGATIRDHGLHAWSWGALAVLVGSLVVAAALLVPWKLRFAVDAGDLYARLYPQAAAEAAGGTFGWLASAGLTYQSLRVANAQKVRLMALLSGVLALLMILQTMLWLLALSVD